MIQKMLKGILALSAAALLMCVGILVGGRFEEDYQQHQEAQVETIKRIAVVNLDDGIDVDGKKTYYAQNMIVLPGEEFVMTNLADARNGINQGVYAAYIIIPATFSKSVESINGTPVRISLQYELNKNLQASVKSEVVEELFAFQSQLSENTTYIYVSAILREYHTAQDSSKTVLANGTRNLDALNNVVVEDLFEPLVNPELALPDFVLSDFDFSDFLNNNMGISDAMNQNFSETMEMGLDSFEYVKDAHREVESETERLTGFVSEMEVNKEVYESGVGELRQMIDTYNQDQRGKRNWVKAELASQSNATRAQGQSYVDTILSLILGTIRSDTKLSIDTQSRDAQEQIDSGLAALQQENLEIIEAEIERLQQEQEEAYLRFEEYVEIRLEEINARYEEQANDWKDQLIEDIKDRLILSEEGEDSDDKVDAALHSLLATLSDARVTLATSSDTWFDMEANREHFPTLATPDFALRKTVPAGAPDKDESLEFWLKLPFFSVEIPEARIELPQIDTGSYDASVNQLEVFYHISTENVEQILNDNVIGAIEHKIDENSLDLREVIEEFTSRTDDYQRSLDEYDPFEFIDMGFLNQALSDMDRNMGDMERTIHEKVAEEEELVGEIYQISTDNTSALEETMRSTYDISQENVIRTVKELRGRQEENYTEDKQLLETFAEKLSHTRIGSVDNKAVYDFIVNPVSLVAGDTAKAKFFQFDTDYKSWIALMILLFGGLTAVLVIIHCSMIYYKKIHKKQRRTES